MKEVLKFINSQLECLAISGSLAIIQQIPYYKHTPHDLDLVCLNTVHNKEILKQLKEKYASSWYNKRYEIYPNWVDTGDFYSLEINNIQVDIWMSNSFRAFKKEDYLYLPAVDIVEYKRQLSVADKKHINSIKEINDAASLGVIIYPIKEYKVQI